MSRVAPAQRFTASHPCPVCGGHDGLPRGASVRCAGFYSDDGRWAHCTREEHAGGLRQHMTSLTYAHRLDSPCGCGRAHDATPRPRAMLAAASNGHAPAPGRRVVATYAYQDEAGALLFEVIRYEPRKFSQRRPDGHGGWIYDTEGVRRVLYRLPELTGQEGVYVVEGEKDAEALRDQGLPATTSPGGADQWSQWGDDYTSQLRAAGIETVVIIPDNDRAGVRYAAAVEHSCRDAGLTALVVPLPGLPPVKDKHGEDVSVWLNAGHTVTEIEALVEAAIAELALTQPVAPVFDAGASADPAASGSSDPGPTVTPLGPPVEAASPAVGAPSTLAREAYYGLAGRAVACIEPSSEADPAAILLHVLIGAGNLIGRSVYAMVESTRHCCNEFAVLVGDSAKGRKGQAWSTPRALFERVNPEWTASRVRTGLSSGEGLIYHVRDAREEQEPVKDRGKVVGYQTIIADPGESDKRLLIFEPELASVLRRMNGETSSLSALLRQAWESGDLSTLTRRDPLRATGAHISAIAHVTREELIANLTETEKANGFANRFLFCLVRRSKLLPDGGRVPEAALAPVIDELRAVAAYAAREPRELRRTDEAAEVFRAIYPKLSAGEPGLLGAVLARAEAHVLRLSLLYAALDCAEAVAPGHLEAALALWDFADTSARAIFAGRSGMADQDALVAALRARGPLSQTEISALFHRNKPAQQLEALLRLAEEAGRIRKAPAALGDRRGRPVTRWEALS